MPAARPRPTAEGPAGGTARPAPRAEGTGDGAPGAPALSPFAYAIVRVVPRVERGEAFNAGIVLFCRPRRYLRARVHLDEDVLHALAPGCDAAAVREHLEVIPRIAAGESAAGSIARLSQSERFHWLVAPSSTILQRSEVHTGLTADPDAMLEHLFRTLVLDRP